MVFLDSALTEVNPIAEFNVESSIVREFDDDDSSVVRDVFRQQFQVERVELHGHVRQRHIERTVSYVNYDLAKCG